MKRFLFFAAAGCLLLSGNYNGPALAQKGKGASAPVVVNKATSRTTISISGKEHPHTETKFSVTWNSSTPPKAFYYRPDPAHWLLCKATKTERRPFGSGPTDFMEMDVWTRVTDLKSGDMINLKPEEHPSDIQPDAVKKMPAGALFYQLKNSNKWQYVKVSITKLPDAKRP